MLINIIQNTIGGLISAGFSIVREGLKMFLPLRYSQQLGEELVVNGDFATDSDWTKETGWTISGGKANFSGGSGNRNMSQAIGITNGKTYEIKYTVSSISAGAVSVRLGGMSGISEVTATTTGVFSGFITANSSANGNVQIEDNDNNFVGSIDNVSVKEYLGQEVVPDSGCGSWLLEDESTNLVPYSEDFSQWSNGGGITITPNFGIAPNGEYVSTKIDFTSPSKYISQTTSLGVGVVFSGFVYVKGLLNETITIDIGGFQLPFVLNGEWQKYEYSDTSTSSTIGLNTFGTATATVIEVWGAQLEQQSYATSYIPTSGASSTRLRDLATDSGNATLINSTEGVLYAEISALADDGAIRYITISDGTVNNILSITFFNNSTITSRITIGGTNTYLVSGVITQTDNFKVALKWGLNNYALWVNGVEVDSNNLLGVFAPDTMSTLDFKRASTLFYGKTKALAVFPYLTDAELTALTTI
jgi:hypothetical protein